MNPGHAAAARLAARDAGKQVGQWLEEAITEKREREKEAEDVTKTDRLGTRDQPRIPVLHGQREASVAEGFVPALHGSC